MTLAFLTHSFLVGSDRRTGLVCNVVTTSNATDNARDGRTRSKR